MSVLELRALTHHSVRVGPELVTDEEQKDQEHDEVAE